MARIAVLEPHSSHPSFHISKSGAHSLVRRLLAVWVTANTIRRIEANLAQTNAIPARFELPHKPYIPEKLPPAEVGGCRFKLTTQMQPTQVLRLQRLRFKCAT